MTARAKAAVAAQPGDRVLVFGHPDVVDGAQGVVLGINGRWLSVHLSQSGANIIVRAERIRQRGDA